MYQFRKGDPCRFGDGNPIAHPKSGTCSSCYGYCRRYSNEKSPKERATQISVLLLRGRRLQAVDAKMIQIGKSPFRWKKNPTPLWKRVRTSFPRSLYRH